MPEFSLLTIVAGLMLLLSGVLVLRTAWKQKTRDWPRIGLGWGLIATSFVPWVMASTGDFGGAFALILFMLVGLGAIAYAGLREPKAIKIRARREPQAGEQEATPWLVYARRVYVFLLAGPIAAIAALLLSVALFGALRGGNEAYQVFYTLFAFPIVWAVLSVVATYDSSVLRRSLYVFGVGLLGGGTTLMLM